MEAHGSDGAGDAGVLSVRHGGSVHHRGAFVESILLQAPPPPFAWRKASTAFPFVFFSGGIRLLTYVAGSNFFRAVRRGGRTCPRAFFALL